MLDLLTVNFYTNCIKSIINENNYFIVNIVFSMIKYNVQTIKIYLYFRLWGDLGQQDLETAHVCLINATTLGTEILKSLILPGIGAFTIIDNEIITEEDVGSK